MKDPNQDFGHDHDHSHSHGEAHRHDHAPGIPHHHSPLKNISAAFFLNLVFTLIELAGGVLTSSVAILADAIHDLGDTVSLGMAFYFEKISTKKRDREYSYGYRRFSLLAAVLSGTVILAGSLLILFESLPRFFNPHVVHPRGMIGLACLGLAINGWAAIRLRRGSSHNEKMLSWHLLEDALGWALVLVGAIVIYYKQWYWLDPVMAVGLALFVMFNVGRNLKKTVEVLLQKTPDKFDEQRFLTFVKSIQGVQDAHDLHVWSVDGVQHVLSVHLVLRSDASPKAFEIKSQIQKFVSQMGSFHTTLETELVGENCNENCDEQRSR